VGVGIAVQAGGGAGADQGTRLHHEVGVALDERVLGVVVHGVHDLLEEILDVRVAARDGCKLGDPDILPTGLVDVGGMLEELSGVGVVVPVHSAEVKLATTATRLDPGLQPVDTLTGDIAVGNGRRADTDFVGVLVHNGLVLLGGFRGRHVALADIVLFIEGEEGLGALTDGFLGSGGPAVEDLQTPHHRHVLDVAGCSSIPSCAPVV